MLTLTLTLTLPLTLTRTLILALIPALTLTLILTLNLIPTRADDAGDPHDAHPAGQPDRRLGRRGLREHAGRRYVSMLVC